MKRIIILLLLLAISLPLFITPSYGLSLPDDYVVPKINTLEEYQQWQKENPPLDNIVWDKFSVLGEYVPQYVPEAAPEPLLYSYDSGDRVYFIAINDLSKVHTMWTGSPELSKEWIAAAQYWNEIIPFIDKMTMKEYREAYFSQPECDDILVGSPYNWIELNDDIANSDLTLRKDEAIYNHFNAIACVGDNLVFKYDLNGLITIEWVHNGLKYQLNCEDKLGDPNRYEYFNETDIDIVRRLTNLETCEEALNELMSEISDNAVAEMPKGMPRDELTGGSNDGSGENSGGDTTAPGGDTTAPGDDTTDTGENAIGSDENEENKDSKTESVLPWVFLGAAGVLVLATALGILLHSRKKH